MVYTAAASFSKIPCSITQKKIGVAITPPSDHSIQLMGNGAISLGQQKAPPRGGPKSPVSERSVHLSWGGSRARSLSGLSSEGSAKRTLPRVPSARNAVLAVKKVFSNESRVLLEHYMPPFCLMDPVLSPEVGDITKNTWESIINGDAQGFRTMKEVHPHISALTYFYDRFYSQLFFLYPEVRHFFQGSIAHQGRRLVKSMMGLATMVCYDKNNVDKKLVWLANKHSEACIHPQYYGGFMWNILITLRHCLGTDWTPEVEEAWVISASYMLRVMVPIAVQGTKHFASPYTVPKHNPEAFSYEGHGSNAGGPKPNALGGPPPGTGLETIPDNNPLNGYTMPETHNYEDSHEEEKQKLFATPSLPSTPKAPAGGCPVFHSSGTKGAPARAAQEVQKISRTSMDSVEEAFAECTSSFLSQNK